jgi:hypothetical protein
LCDNIATKVRGLCRRFTDNLKEWGFAEVDHQAVEILPLGPAKLKGISQNARQTDAAHINARRAYAEHVANCLMCSRHLVEPEIEIEDERTGT